MEERRVGRSEGGRREREERLEERKGEREREREIQLHLSVVHSCIGRPCECACIGVCVRSVDRSLTPGARSTLRYTYSKLHKTHDADALQAVSNLI